MCYNLAPCQNRQQQRPQQTLQLPQPPRRQLQLQTPAIKPIINRHPHWGLTRAAPERTIQYALLTWYELTHPSLGLHIPQSCWASASAGAGAVRVVPSCRVIVPSQPGHTHTHTRLGRPSSGAFESLQRSAGQKRQYIRYLLYATAEKRPYPRIRTY